MTIEQLGSIVKLMCLEQICIALEQLGYRNATKYGEWEFNPLVIADGKTIETDYYEDFFDDKKYIGEIVVNVDGYKDYEFIVVTVIQIHRHLNNKEMPCNMLLFTNAPVNAEYEKRMAEIGTCTLCKKKFAQSELMTINDKIYCEGCFHADIERIKSGKKPRILKGSKKKIRK